MKKLLFILMLLFPLQSFGDEPPITIPISEDLVDKDEMRHETGIHFTAEILSNTAIKIISDQISTFNVKILDASATHVLYQGVTVDGIFHITGKVMAVGHYVLRIDVHGVAYVGEFDIAE